MSEKLNLIVTSKVKQQIKAKAGFNTSAEVIDQLNKKVDNLLDQAMAKAKEDGRKTVMGRDFDGLALTV